MLILLFCKPLFIQGYCFIQPQKRELSVEINMEMCIIEKSKKINSEEPVSRFSLKPLKMAHDTIQ